jgi:hypothetical protein
VFWGAARGHAGGKVDPFQGPWVSRGKRVRTIRIGAEDQGESLRVDRQSPPAIFRRLRDASSGSAAISPCGGIGRRARLKIEFRKECWFDSGQGHQLGCSSPF